LVALKTIIHTDELQLRLEVNVTVSPQIVFTAIYAGLRLYHAGYTAYIDSTRNGALTLPLPRGPITPTVTTALAFFTETTEGKAIAAVEKNDAICPNR
jgi:hypothetical protein